MEPAEQIEALRKIVRRGIPVWLIGLAMALACALLIAGIATRNPICFVLSAFATVLAVAVRQTAPHIRNAVKAFECGTKKSGSVHITFTEWSDTRHYHANIQMSDSLTWSFEFIPLDWKPNEGAHEAIVFALQDIAWPVLVQVEQGLIYPRDNPKLMRRETGLTG